MLDVRVGDTCSASTDGWTIATNSIGYLRRGAASHANPHAHAHARGQAQRVARTRFANLPYDENVSQGVMRQRVTIELGLYRVRVDELRARRRAR